MFRKTGAPGSCMGRGRARARGRRLELQLVERALGLLARGRPSLRARDRRVPTIAVCQRALVRAERGLRPPRARAPPRRSRTPATPWPRSTAGPAASISTRRAERWIDTEPTLRVFEAALIALRSEGIHVVDARRRPRRPTRGDEPPAASALDLLALRLRFLRRDLLEMLPQVRDVIDDQVGQRGVVPVDPHVVERQVIDVVQDVHQVPVQHDPLIDQLAPVARAVALDADPAVGIVVREADRGFLLQQHEALEVVVAELMRCPSISFFDHLPGCGRNVAVVPATRMRRSGASTIRCSR